jgi:hypothetical protein
VGAALCKVEQGITGQPCFGVITYRWVMWRRSLLFAWWLAHELLSLLQLPQQHAGAWLQHASSWHQCEIDHSRVDYRCCLLHAPSFDYDVYGHTASVGKCTALFLVFHIMRQPNSAIEAKQGQPSIEAAAPESCSAYVLHCKSKSCCVLKPVKAALCNGTQLKKSPIVHNW